MHKPCRSIALIACSFLTSVLVILSPAGMTADPDAQPAAGSHDIYNPARTALLNAQRQLTESARQEQEVLDHIKRIRSELDTSLNLLASAEQQDAARAKTISGIRSRLDALQDSPTLCPVDDTDSIGEYHRLIKELQQLIDQY